MTAKISVVTPTLYRPDDVAALIENLSRQTTLPYELVLVDAAPPERNETRDVVSAAVDKGLPYEVVYIRRGGGTAIQRNIGIDAARGNFIAFIDDDVRLAADFFSVQLEVYAQDASNQVGGVAGYITNQYLDANKVKRWRWYRRLKLFNTYEPGRYDYYTGYPINRYLQPPHDGVREIDFMGSNCGLWRREVFDEGLRFAEFFTDYGVLEDAHLALRAGRKWKLLECGRARCVHLSSPGGRVNSRKVAWKTAVNYRYVFMDIVPDRTVRQEVRFWTVQVFDLFRQVTFALRTWARRDWMGALGKLEGIIAAAQLRLPENRS